MTKCIVLQNEQMEKKKTPITFDKCLGAELRIEDAGVDPDEYGYIELICQNYIENKDLMYAYDNPMSRGSGSLFIGHWNDGVVE